MPVLTFCCWLLLVWGSGWCFFPVARRIFGDTLPDQGLAVGRCLFLGLWTLGAFWLGHLGVPVQTAALLWIALAGIGIAVGISDREELPTEISTRKRAILAGESIFLAVFLSFFLLRGFWSDTDGTNGEKSMDSALIGSLTRAQSLPPANPYSAGAKLYGYYYFGHLETALLTDATGTTTRWSYNLMCATIPALCFSTLFALGAGLTGRLKGGAFIVVTVLMMGTLQPIIQWRNVVPAIISSIGSGSLKPLAPWNQNSGFTSTTPLHLDFFATSRVIPYSINEYPWFTFNQADLHAHYFDFTFALATLCLAYALFHGRKIAYLPASLMLGAQLMTNTWDFPAYGIVMGLAILCAISWEKFNGAEEIDAVEAAPNSQPQNDLGKRFGLAVVVVLAALVVAAPYLLGLKSSATRPTPLPQPASPLREWVTLWGLFVVAWLCFLNYTLFQTSERRKFMWGLCLSGSVAILAEWMMRSWWIADTKVYSGSSLIIPIILICLALSVAGAWRLRGVPRFLCFLAIGGLFALLWCETTWAGFLGDPNVRTFEDSKRQDTVFKFGLQVWLLWGIAASAGAYITLKKWPEWVKCAFILLIPVLVISSLAVTFGRAHNFLLWNGQGQWVGFKNRPLNDPFFKWNGWDAWAHLTPGEQEAATFLLNNTPPGENLVEAEMQEGGDYTNYTRYAHTTGIPTVIGPQAHAFQWGPADGGGKNPEWEKPLAAMNLSSEEMLIRRRGREWDEVFRRKGAVRNFYLSPDLEMKKAFLKAYHVKYIVWGELERAQYGGQSLDFLRGTCQQVAHFGHPGDVREVWIFAAPSP